MSEGTVNSPLPNNTSVMEPKVKWGAVGTYVAGVVGLALVNALTGNDNELIVAALPDYLEAFILPLVPAIGQIVAAYNAQHQWRRAEVSGVPNSNTSQLG